MFRTYYCDRETATIHEIGRYETREKAEAAAEEEYADDARCGEFGFRQYAVEDEDYPGDYDDQIVFPVGDYDNFDNEEDDDDDD